MTLLLTYGLINTSTARSKHGWPGKYQLRNEQSCCEAGHSSIGMITLARFASGTLTANARKFRPTFSNLRPHWAKKSGHGALDGSRKTVSATESKGIGKRNTWPRESRKDELQ